MNHKQNKSGAQDHSDQSKKVNLTYNSSDACPAFFKYGCAEAAANHASCSLNMLDCGYDMEKWQSRLRTYCGLHEDYRRVWEELQELVDANDEQGIDAWFDHYLQRCACFWQEYNEGRLDLNQIHPEFAELAVDFLPQDGSVQDDGSWMSN